MNYRDVINRLLGDRGTDAVDFEITLAALLATISFAYPLPKMPAVSQIAGGVLLLITLVRRMATVGPFAREDEIMRKTVPILEIFSVVAIVCLSLVATNALNQSTQILVIGGGLTVSAILLSLLHEYLFRDYMIWWFAKFSELAKDSNLKIWGELAAIALTASLHIRSLSDKARIRGGYPEDLSSEFPDYSTLISITTQTLVLVAVAFSIPMGISWYFLGFEGIFFVIGIFAIRDVFRFWYMIYGATTFDEISSSLSVSISLTTLYVLGVIAYTSAF
jgi:hypothetical protein